MKFLNEREELVLRTIIDEYINTSEPVGSRNVSKVGPLKMSPATIRNIMSDLVDKGYIIQPHTSAGRVPTDVGYRYYIDKLISIQSINQETLEKVEKEMIFDPINVMSIFRNFSKKLSSMTNSIGFIMLPKISTMYIKHIEFIKLTKNIVLVVLVTQNGIIENILLNINTDITEQDLIRISNYLNIHFPSSSLIDIKRRLINELKKEESEVKDLIDKTKTLSNALFSSDTFEEKFIFEGTSNIIEMPEFKESAKLKDILKAFDEKRNICNMLESCMQQDTVQIFVGSEIGLKNIEELGMVIKPYHKGGDIIGALGVIGPKRMKYPQVASIVDYSSGIISKMISEYYEGNNEE